MVVFFFSRLWGFGGLVWGVGRYGPCVFIVTYMAWIDAVVLWCDEGCGVCSMIFRGRRDRLVCGIVVCTSLCLYPVDKSNHDGMI